MSHADVDAFLADCDDVIADWEGSADSATWTADGSHQQPDGYLRTTTQWRGLTVSEDLRPYLTLVQERIRDLLEVQPLRPSGSYQTASASTHEPLVHWERRRDGGQGVEVDWTIFDETLGWRP